MLFSGSTNSADSGASFISSEMPPLAAPVEKDGSRQRNASATAAGVAKLRVAQRSASFHGRATAEQERHLLKQRPRTQPDLLAGVRERSFRRTTADREGAPTPAGGGPAPSKLLVTVAVLQSMWPLHVMACTGWRVADLVAAAVELYVREGRRPLLPSADPSAFGLHYSQFSLQSLDPEEKLMELGSRSFFLCPKAAAASYCASTEADKTASPIEPNRLLPWLGFMHFWPLL